VLVDNSRRRKKFLLGGTFLGPERLNRAKWSDFISLAQWGVPLHAAAVVVLGKEAARDREMMSKDRRENPPARGAASGRSRKTIAGKEDWIGAHLRKVYDEALNEPVPDRFLALLKEIDKKERGT